MSERGQVRRPIVVIGESDLAADRVGTILGVPTVKLPNVPTAVREPLAAPVAVLVTVSALDAEGKAIDSLRRRWPHVALLVAAEEERVESAALLLERGADDFLTLPFRAVELRARVLARVLERAERERRVALAFGDLTLDHSTRRLSGPLGETSLPPLETRLLALLFSAAGAPVPRARLKQQAWGARPTSDNALDRRLVVLRDRVQRASALVQVKSRYGEGVMVSLEARPSLEE